MMILSQIVDHYPTLKLQDTLLKAGKLFDQYLVNSLAVVDKGIFKGVLSTDTLKKHYPDQKISSILDELERESAEAENDILTTLPLFEKYNSKIIAVTDQQHRFMGYFERDSLANEIIQSGLNAEEGGIIKITFHQQQDVLSQIIRIVEEHKGTVIKSYLKDRKEENKLPVLVLQIKTEQLGFLVQQLERHGYLIENSFRLVGSEDFEHDRYDSLMKYLNI